MPRCGFLVETQEKQIFKCPRCDLKLNRHKIAPINISRRHLEGGKRRKKRKLECGFPTEMILRLL